MRHLSLSSGTVQTCAPEGSERVVSWGGGGSGLYSGTWELGTPKGLSKTFLNSEVVLFLRSISTC